MTSYPAPPFSSSHTAFERLVTDLSGDTTATLDHGELERFIHLAGRELMRSLFQDHLDFRQDVRPAAVMSQVSASEE